MVSKSRKINLVSKLNPDVFTLINKDIFGTTPLPLGSTHGAVNRIISPDYDQLLKATMPSLLALNPNDASWYKRVKSYWDSFSLKVPIGGKELEIGFNFSIDDTTKKAAITDLTAKSTKESTKEGSKATPINSDESLASYVLKHVPEFEKYKYATPINVEQYLTWLFCLGHRAVAKEAESIDKSTNIQFILIDPEKIEDTRREQHKLSVKALEKYLALLTNRALVRDILFVKQIDASNLDDVDVDARLKQLVDTNPKEFLSIVNDNSMTTKARIEKYCIAGILKRLPSSSIIVDANDPGIVIGNTTDEAIAFFSSETPDRVAKVKEFQTRFNQIQKTNN